MTILSVKLPDGTWVDIPAIVGPPGPSGVHIGTDTPPETANVWINPNGEPTGTEDWEFDLDDGSVDTKQVVVLNSDESSGQLAILRFRQADGTWTDIPAIKGDPGIAGKDGKDGIDGKTPVKGEDYNDGDKGEPGDSGVYIGNGTPPATANVWVNPTGEPTSTEDWEFDLDDGSTDTKQVVVINSDEATANGTLGILRVRQADGTWQEIPALIGGKGDKGDPGYTPQKNVDYFDGKNGKDGQNGKDGVSATHSWNGTTLTVTSASGTSSANLKGDKGDTGEVDYSRLNNYLPLAGGTMTGELRVNGGDAAGGSKIVLETDKGQITNSATATLFGYTAASTLAVGHSTAVLAMRGSGTRPKYNSNDLALKSDIPAVTKETWTFTLENGSTVTKVVHIG